MSTKLTKLSDRHYTAIRMKIEGYSGREIAEALNTNIRQVYLWFSDALIKEELDNQRGRIFDLFAERMTDLTMRAFRRLEEMADMEVSATPLTTEQKLEILREILDRNPMTQKQHQEKVPAGTPAMPPAHVSDAELMAQFKAVAQVLPEVIDGSASANGHPD